MSAQPYRFLALAVLLGAAVLLAAEPRGPDSTEKKSGAKETPADKAAELLHLSRDDIVYVVDQAMDALKLAPRLVVLTPEKWKEIQAELAALRAKIAPDRPPTPSTIEILKGKVEGNLATLTVQFVFATERPNTLVPLGCGQGLATNVLLDGGTPGGFKRVGDGWAVLVEKPATDHQLTLDLLVSLTTRGTTGRALLLDLPRAPVTNIKELTLPAGIKELRAGDRALADTFLKLDGTLLSGSLGIIDKLDLGWRSAGTPSGTGPILNARGTINVRVDEKDKQKVVSTEAELTLEPLGGPARVWELLVPAKADVKVALDEKRFRIDPDLRTASSKRTITLTEPSEEPFKVTVTLENVPLRPGTPVPVGPFLVLGALKQSGNIVVSSTAPGLRVECKPRGDVSPRELTEDEKHRDGVEAFTYRAISPPGKPPPNPVTLAMLDVDGQVVQRPVEVRAVTHTLKLMRDEAGWYWQLLTTLDAQPIWTGADRLAVQLPDEWKLDESNPPAQAKRVQRVDWEAERRQVVFRLARGSSEGGEPLQLILKANGPRAKDADTATLALPQVVAAIGRGGTIVVQAPEDMELLASSANPSLQLSEQTPHRQTWRPGPSSDRLAERVAVAWRPYRPAMHLVSETDLTLREREGEVRQTLRLVFSSKTTQFELRVPAAVGPSLRVEAGGTLNADAGPLRTISLQAEVGREHVLVLAYSFVLTEEATGPRGGRLLQVPLVQPARPAQGEARLRVWTDQGPLPAPVGDDWEEKNIEVVEGKPGLPVLVLRPRGRLDAPLTLSLGEGSSSPVTVLIKHGLARVVVNDGGVDYRISYLLKGLAARQIDLEMPAPVASINLSVTLDGREVVPGILDDAGHPAEGGRVARLKLDRELGRKPAVLEVNYHLPPSRGGVLQTVLRPPVVHGDSGQVPLRWQVTLPPLWVVLGPESGEERTWGRRGWLLAARPALTTRKLEEWFAGKDVPLPTDDDPPATPSLIVWGVSGEPLTVLHAPQQTWVLVCSLALVVLGVIGFLAARSGPDRRAAAWLWPLCILLATAAVVAALLWPTLTAAVAYGCEWGALILLIAGLVQGLLHVRYRRQIVFLPSFTRSRPGSSLLRSPVPRPHGEPSTVDAPRPGSSNWPEGEPPEGR